MRCRNDYAENIFIQKTAVAIAEALAVEKM